MNRLVRILSAVLGVMGFAAAVRESIEDPAPGPDAIRSEGPVEFSDPGDGIQLERSTRLADIIAVRMGDIVVGKPRHEPRDTSAGGHRRDTQ